MAGAILPGKQPPFFLGVPKGNYLLGGDGRDLVASGYHFWLQIPMAQSDHQPGSFLPRL